jgi:hypothetical protein
MCVCICNLWRFFRRVEFQVHSFFAVDSRWSWMVRFTHRKLQSKNTNNDGIWGYVCRQSFLSMYAKRERSTLRQGIDPRFTCRSGLKMVTIDWATVTPIIRLLYLLQGKNGYTYEKISCLLWVCVCSSSFHVSNHWTDFHEIMSECYALADYIVAAPLGFLQSVLATSR